MLVEKNREGYWEIGMRRYLYYTKTQAEKLYRKEVNSELSVGK